MSLTVTNETDADRYAVYDGDELQGFIIYEHAGTTLRLLHAEVPTMMRGKGVGGDVVRAILDHLQSESTDRVQPVCGFVVAWMRRNPDYAILTTR